MRHIGDQFEGLGRDMRLEIGEQCRDHRCLAGFGKRRRYGHGHGRALGDGKAVTGRLVANDLDQFRIFEQARAHEDRECDLRVVIGQAPNQILRRGLEIGQSLGQGRAHVPLHLADETAQDVLDQSPFARADAGTAIGIDVSNGIQQFRAPLRGAIARQVQQFFQSHVRIFIVLVGKRGQFCLQAVDRNARTRSTHVPRLGIGLDTHPWVVRKLLRLSNQ